MKNMQSFLRSVLDFLLPAAREVHIAEALTEANLRSLVSPRTVLCGADEALALLPYANTSVKAALWALKYRGSDHAARLFAAVLGEALQSEWADADLSVAPIKLAVIPRSAESMRRYGGNHLERVIADLPSDFRQVSLADALLRDAHAVRQTPLRRKERMENMRGMLSVTPGIDVSGAHIIVIDDVVTTGATLGDAARALRAGGARSLSLIALAYS